MLNRITADHCSKSEFDLNAIFIMTKMMYLGSYFEMFSKCVLEEAVANVAWHQCGGPSPGVEAQHEKLVRLAMPGLHLEPRRCHDVRASLVVLNGRWNSKSVAHHCIVGSDGRPCCASIDDVKGKLKDAVAKLLLSNKPPVPCTTRWLTCVGCTGWWSLGITVCDLFTRGGLKAWPLSAKALRVPDAALQHGANLLSCCDCFECSLAQRAAGLSACMAAQGVPTPIAMPLACP